MKNKSLWITGLSGSGKSTLAKEVTFRLRKQGEKVVLFDGDELRKIFRKEKNINQNYVREERLALGIKYGRLCQVIAKQGFTVVIATIGLFKEVHAWNRKNLPGYFEIYLKVPMEELQRRDANGIYSSFNAGTLNNVVGLDINFDEPKKADWICEYKPGLSVETMVDELLKKINEKDEN